MTSHDIWLLSPELSVVGLAVLLVLLDVVVRRKGFLSVLGVVGLAVPLGLSIALWFDLNGDGVVASQGVFGTLVVDKFSLFFKFLFVAVAAIIVLVSVDYVKKFQRFQAEYYALVLLSTVGMMLLASTLELITIFIALELTALPIAALAAFLRDDRSSESGLKFLILSAISSAVLLYGMVIVYGFTGTTVLEDISGQIKSMNLSGDTPFGSYALLFGIVLMIAGFGFKIASVPFQMWAPDVYEGSPTPVTAYLSVASKAAGFAVILRVFYVAFPMEVISLDWSAVFAVLSGLSMTIGNLVAIRQDNIKRLLAYSTIAHAGYLMMGLAAISARVPGGEADSGPSAVIFYLSGYAATNLAAFSAIIAISNRIGSDMVDDFAGMSRRSPYLSGVLGFALVSLIGVPPTIGFVAKLYVFGAAVDANLEWLVLLGVLNSVISAYYYLRIIKVMYLSPPAEEEPVHSGPAIRLAMLSTFAAVAFFGIYPTPLLRLARTAAEVLLQ
jgi:NADH-quinone oxidoreductase subunit N